MIKIDMEGIIEVYPELSIIFLSDFVLILTGPVKFIEYR